MKRLFFLLIVLMIISCKTEDVGDYTTGSISYSDPAVDGCGWYFNFAGGGFPITNLDKKYQKEGIKVRAIYERVGKRRCGFGEVEYIEIKKIKGL